MLATLGASLSSVITMLLFSLIIIVALLTTGVRLLLPAAAAAGRLPVLVCRECSKYRHDSDEAGLHAQSPNSPDDYLTRSQTDVA